ncbi:MAG: molybdopterin molybdotransferase MoeA [Steroidobacteraceae bacterium]
MMDPAAAEAAIRAHVRLLPTEHRPLSALHGAVLREPLVAARDQPPFHRVTMDGIACASQAVAGGQRSFRIAGTQPAGSAPLQLTDPNTCFEVMTGAVAPEGCDCVIPVERLKISDGVAVVNEDVAVSPWLNIHTRGLDGRAGQVLLEAGTRVGPTAIALAATTGLPRVCVSRAPRIAIISTGSELVEPGAPVADWQIYRSNAYALASALRARGYDQLTDEHVPDDLPVLRERLGAQLERQDVLILSGGVSMGRFDYVPQVLGELGVRMIFHGVAQRPGKPLWFGVSDAGKAVFALPGNPVSTAACLARYVYAGLDAALGTPTPPPGLVALQADYEVKPALAVFLPVELERDAEARQWARPRPTQGSGDFISLLGTQGFVQAPPGPQRLKRGTLLPFYAW